MIQGYATPESSREFAVGHLPSGCTVLGATDLTVSAAGFGCYRVTTATASHGTSLRLALESGINLIDTSTNYADGGSESLVGQVLESLVASNGLSRESVIVVSKAGYLQGQNYALSRKRQEEGRPFPECVPVGDGIEHCIHPVFLADQLDRSLDRLGLGTLDVYLLHNPEYYLGWALKNGLPLDDARRTYYRRIERAFGFLEGEVEKGRIRFYGISSNTFPAAADDPEFTSLTTVWETAESISPAHHFRVVQMPMNLLETGAVLEKNQSERQSVLDYALEKRLGVLINRPLNAFSGGQLVRLADIGETEAREENEIIGCIRSVSRSETRLWRKILPGLDIPQGLKLRVKEQVAVADGLKHYWRNFGSWERWCQVRDGNFRPRVRGVVDFLKHQTGEQSDLSEWLSSHTACLENAYDAVGSIYAEAAAVKLARIGRAVAAADPDWPSAGRLSQKAVRALRSTLGVSSVLVGMRSEGYVEEVLAELDCPVEQKTRRDAWNRLENAMDA